LFTASRSAFQLAGAEQTRNFADLLHCLGDCLDEQGKHDEAFRIFKQAQHVFELCGLSKTTNYAELLANMADCMKKQGLEKDSAQVLDK
ncbi:SWA2, partial [Symbiodinium sp. CCMP2456]